MEKSKTKVQPSQPKVKTIQVPIQVSQDVNLRTGLRGLKGLVFERFNQAFTKTGDFKALPGMDELTKEVGEKFPQSRWLARPKIHYSYYKSKFISAHQLPATPIKK